ncbi:membrane protein MLC1 isoform X3 [Phyllopteryx taeniolatus]|uniref:membrane protein MLC1 isoform X3 n=1 Tax=Phyllopteryx taeniolatus TaxID=161469 RepID=UPI002AD43388|nr:membrane protein MLC1 isoform X3 [Phyllopteryx taeniolatus]
MQREEVSAREEFTYSPMSTLERGTLGRRGSRGADRGERDSYTVDVRASDLQLAQPEPPKHPCFNYRAWLYSVLIGGSLLITSGFSLYLGNLFPVAMDYLRCAAGAGLPAAIASFAIAKNRHVAINFNLILMILLEVLMATTVILSARSGEDCCCHRRTDTSQRPLATTPAVFPARLLKAYSVIEVIVGISAVFGGIIALNMDALLPGPYLSVTFFWILVACFPSAIASHVVSEYPNKCLVEVLIAISSVTSPLLFSASGFLSCSVISLIDIFLHDVPPAKQSYDILLLILLVLLLVQAVLNSATVVHCASYKSHLRLRATQQCDDNMATSDQHCGQSSNGVLQNFSKERTRKAIMVQITQ